ncbi:unnamed protein product [Cuscuta campestris]|uniref:Uncharacterized protein n=1 Tax=Cuscuta campestris TaxID=132261 RepID=A0A484L625_9ASTE|nr:unnamed protein product [Cuscuta campestris]
MEVSRQISLFRSQIQNRRFDDATLRILESILVSGDAKSLNQIASALKDFMRRESLCILRETSALRSVDDHLLIVEFLVRVFALIGDDESCLALRMVFVLLLEWHVRRHYHALMQIAIQLMVRLVTSPKMCI